MFWAPMCLAESLGPTLGSITLLVVHDKYVHINQIIPWMTADKVLLGWQCDDSTERLV